MKIKLILSFTFLSMATDFLYSQITIDNIEKKEEKIVLKPEPYDSLKNFKFQEGESRLQYNQYIGLQLFLPPISNPDPGIKNFDRLKRPENNFLFSINPTTIHTNIAVVENYKIPECDSIITYVYKPFHYSSEGTSFHEGAGISSDAKEVSNTYFTVIGILYDQKRIDTLQHMHSKLDKMRNNEKKNIFVQRLEVEMGEDYIPYHSSSSVMFQLRNDKTGDLLYCSRPEKLILVPFFVKQKALFQNKNLINDGSTFEKVDIVTNKKVVIANGSKWVCSAVTLLKKSQAYPKDYQWGYNGDSSSYSLFIILKNAMGETIAIDKLENGYENNIILKNGNSETNFITEQAYIQREQEKKLKQEELTAKLKQEEKTRKEKEKQAKEKHKAECVGKFGEYNGALIAQGKVKIGMTKEMSKVSWGIPFWSSKSTTEYGVYEDWYYGFGYSLHFKNGVLNRIEE